MNAHILHQNKGCFHLNTCPSFKYCFESTATITLLFQLCSATNKKQKKCLCNQSSHHEKYDLYVPTISYCLESAVAITLRYQLCSAHYTALQMKNSIKIASAVTCLQTYCREAMHCATASQHLGLSAKRNGTQRGAKVSP